MNDIGLSREEERRLYEEMEAEDRARKGRPSYTPERSRLWFFWRMFGFFLRIPLRRVWGHYASDRYINGKWTPRFASSKRVRDWMWHGRGKIRRFLYWFLLKDYNCPCCGFDAWSDDELTFYDRQGNEIRTITNLMEVVDSGTSYYEGEYWGEGWQWCYRCGSVEWRTL